MPYLPRELFLTKGVGRHKEKLASFEEALRDAKIARFNLTHVSSIYPPHCKIVPVNKGLTKLQSGQVIAVVIARNETNENRRLVATSIGVAIPSDKKQYGYLSEHHSYGETEEQAGEYAEDLAASMLATTLGLDYETSASWDQREEQWKISGKIVRTLNCTQSAQGIGGLWTTVVASAVLIP
ncbi:MAG TPA: arginine decarboxylase, pyruvoyl-dependent [Planctomycetota bacterium]|nr:arginine decarboxylase, pyruvoyl-dependent [Planctomycetota bacterium]